MGQWIKFYLKSYLNLQVRA